MRKRRAHTDSMRRIMRGGFGCVDALMCVGEEKVLTEPQLYCTDGCCYWSTPTLQKKKEEEERKKEMPQPDTALMKLPQIDSPSGLLA